MAISLARAKRERAALLRDIARELKKKNRAKLVQLRGRVRVLRAEARQAIASAIARCRAGRRLPTLKQVAAELRAAKRAARTACDVDITAARAMRDRTAGARAELAAEAKYQKDIRRIEAGQRRKLSDERRRRPGLARSRARERGQESDDEVRSNIPPELVPLFEKVKRSIKGSDRRTRTEAFLEYAQESPGEEWAAIEDAADRAIAEMERRARMPNPKKKKKKRASMADKRRQRARQRRRSKTRPPTAAERAEWAASQARVGNPKKRPPAGSIHQGDLFLAPSGQLVLVDASAEQKARTRKASAAERTIPMFESGAACKNPRRPPKRWFDRCLRSVAARKYARDPAAVCAAAWWRRSPKERERIVRRWERGSRRERRTAVAVAKAERNRADGPRRRNPAMSDAQALAEYERTHWGDRGTDRVAHGRAADPTHGTAAELGELVSVVYRTHKRGDGGGRRRRVEYEHEFRSRLPTLAYNAGGLLVVDGDYRIKAGGITG